MYKGVLTVEGKLDLNQFWPAGESDADTTKLLLKVEGGAFQFKASKSGKTRTTRAFEGAWVEAGRNKDGTPKQKAVINSAGAITVRLQGIDAPELHYRPEALKGAARTKETLAAFKEYNHEYRQHWGRSAAMALRSRLLEFGPGPLDCTFQTAVDAPNDVCDKYGRCVGDVVVQAGKKKLNINQWVVSEGWAVPSFYNSMSAAEIDVLAKLSEQAHGTGKGIWPDYTPKLGAFDFALRHETGKKAKGFQAGDDRGALILPKIYRRQATWACQRKAGALKNTFAQYLTKLSSKFQLVEEYAAQGSDAPWHQLGAYVKAGQFLLWPAEMVLKEDPSTLYSQQGAEVISWW